MQCLLARGTRAAPISYLYYCNISNEQCAKAASPISFPPTVPMYSQNINLLAIARKLIAFEEILLWMIQSEAPKALHASDCNELFDPMTTSCWMFAQYYPGKLKITFFVANEWSI